jgi:hypothetical protein
MNEESNFSLSSKRMKMNNVEDDDDEVEIISSTQDAHIIYTSMWQKVKALCDKIPEKDVLSP